MKSTNRRSFMKSMLAVPFLASGLHPLESGADSISEAFGHKFKLSLNLYSFNQLLRDGEIDLFDVLDGDVTYYLADLFFVTVKCRGYPEIIFSKPRIS